MREGEYMTNKKKDIHTKSVSWTTIYLDRELITRFIKNGSTQGKTRSERGSIFFCLGASCKSSFGCGGI